MPLVIDGEDVLVDGRRIISMTLPRRVRASGEISVLGDKKRGGLVIYLGRLVDRVFAGCL